MIEQCRLQSSSASSSRSNSPFKTRSKDELTKKQKSEAISRALREDPVDITTIRQHAISKAGLINDEIRLSAWPKLLNVNVFNIPFKPDSEVLLSHRDYQQVVLDVNRSLKRFPPGMEATHRESLQDQLVDVIMRVLVFHPELHYYQGYHDICVTFLLVVGEDVTFALMDKLSTNHLRDFMDANMDRTKHMLNYLYPIVGKASPKLREYMEKAELGTIFCLSWLITWFGHVVGDFCNIVRIYDFFLACHPLMPIYLAAAIVLHREKEVLSTECEMCMIHQLLSKIPPDLPFEKLICKAGDLFIQFPPSNLADEASSHYIQSSSISNYSQFEESRLIQRPDSVLKTIKLPRIEQIPVQTIPTPAPAITEQPLTTSGRPYIKATVMSVIVGLSAVTLAVLNIPASWNWFQHR